MDSQATARTSSNVHPIFQQMLDVFSGDAVRAATMKAGDVRRTSLVQVLSDDEPANESNDNARSEA